MPMKTPISILAAVYFAFVEAVWTECLYATINAWKVSLLHTFINEGALEFLELFRILLHDFRQ